MLILGYSNAIVEGQSHCRCVSSQNTWDNAATHTVCEGEKQLGEGVENISNDGHNTITVSISLLSISFRNRLVNFKSYS